MSDISISYARSSEREARAIGEALRAMGYGVWRDNEIPAHRAFSEVIEERLRASKAVVVVWSADATASEWVRSEATLARADRKLVQLSVDGTKPPMPFEQTAIIRFCQRATEIDPDFARAWALMAWSQASLAIDRAKKGDNGLAAAERAEALDPTLGTPHVVKAKVLYDTGRAEEALTELQQALDLDPDAVEVNWTAGGIYFSERRWQESAHVYARNAEIDEGNLGAAGMKIFCYLALNDDEAARAAARVTLERAERALAADRTNGFASSWGATALVALGEVESAKQWINRALLIDPDNLIARLNFACALSIHASDVESAIELLGPVLASDDGRWIRWAMSDAALDPIRDDPRFQEMLAEAQARLAAA